jgi:hypothetical protein
MKLQLKTVGCLVLSGDGHMSPSRCEGLLHLTPMEQVAPYGHGGAQLRGWRTLAPPCSPSVSSSILLNQLLWDTNLSFLAQTPPAGSAYGECGGEGDMQRRGQEKGPWRLRAGGTCWIERGG